MTLTTATWLVPAGDLTLASNHIHIWRVPLDVPTLHVEQLAMTLSPDERLRAARFKFDKHRRRFTVGRGILRRLLGMYLQLPAADIAFFKSQYDKPYVRHMLNGKLLSFNVSHSHELAIYAFALETDVGIDVEHRRPIGDIERIAQQFFSSAESQKLLSLPQDQQQTAFLNCWTRKEAYIKAIGEGLSHPLSSFDVAFAPGEPPALLRVANDSLARNRWQMWAFEPADNYIGALIAATSNPQLSFWQLTL